MAKSENLDIKVLVGTIQFVSTISSVQASQKVEKTVIKNETGTISISQLNKNVWVHTELGYFNGEAVPSNGLVLNTAKGLVLVDSSWDDKLTKELIEMVEKKFQKRVTDVIITHAHADRIGGIKTLKERGIKAHSTALTAELAKKSGYEEPLGDLQTVTNLILWQPNNNIIFCMSFPWIERFYFCIAK
ncbi:MBL fold metallo-hydrolase, partial [Bacillus sp. SS-TM]